jgi:hypothetical protein
MDAPRKGPRPPRNHDDEVIAEESLTFSGVGKITVKTQTGLTDTFDIDFSKEYTDNLKGTIAAKYHLDKRDYVLLSAGHLMDDDKKLSHYGLHDGSEVTLQLKMRSGRGGDKKRKTRKRFNKRKTRKN